MVAPQTYKLFYLAHSGVAADVTSYKYDAVTNNVLMNVGSKESR